MKKRKSIHLNIFQKKNIFYFLILFVFLILSIVVGIHHEPWADEANPWLIARDCSIANLFTTYLHSEGHPALWYLVIKFFQMLGLKYSYFFVIPLLFSTLGLIILLWKSPFSFSLKVLFPFTYFIFYQYTIVARGYSLILLLLSLIAWIYPKRMEKNYIFSLLLILLLSLESYTYLLSGSLFLFYLYDYFKCKKEGKKSLKHYQASIMLLVIAFLVTAIYVFPSSTYSLNHHGSVYFLSDSFFTSFSCHNIIKYFLTVSLISIIYLIYQKHATKRQRVELILIFFPIILFFVFQYYNLWHLGIIFEVFLFCLWIHNFQNNKLFHSLLFFTFIVQIIWSFSSSYYDFKNNYSCGEEVANFLKRYPYQEMEIYGTSYYDVVINPYFSKNIFKNWEPEYSFFYLDYKNRFYQKRVDEAFIEKEKPDIVINSTITGFLNSNRYENKDYHKYYFKGSTYFENKKYENQEIVVYILKEKDKR